MALNTLTLFLLIATTWGKRQEEDITFIDYTYSLILSLSLSLFAGVMSGMTIGLMGIDQISLKLKQESGSPIEKHQANRILPLLKDHHLLLVTLLLANAVALETLPLVIDSVLGNIPAIIFSVLLTIAFSEIIPQALCIGEHRIILASFFAPLVKTMLIALWPISFPIAKLLDKVIGESHFHQFSHEQLKAFFKLVEVENSEKLNDVQIGIMSKSIDLKEVTVGKIMVPKGNVIILDANQEIDDYLIECLRKKGPRRVPVVKNGILLGCAMLKDFLLGINSVNEIKLRKCIQFDASMQVLKAFYLFVESGCQFAVVVNGEEKELIGILDIKDIFRFLMTKEKIILNTQTVSLSENGVDKKPGFFSRIANKFKKNSRDSQTKEFQMIERTDRTLIDDV